MAAPYPIPTLGGPTVRLEPLTLGHVNALVDAANEDRSTYTFTRVPRDRTDTEEYVTGLLEQWRAGDVVPFVQVESSSGRVVGATRFMDLRSLSAGRPPFAVEIGGTWLAASVQRTGVNAAAKLALLDHAFSQWGTVRVDFKTDARNERSRSALARLGATFEGILHQNQPSLVVGEESLFRDSALFCVTSAQWPEIRERLRARPVGE